MAAEADPHRHHGRARVFPGSGVRPERNACAGLHSTFSEARYVAIAVGKDVDTVKFSMYQAPKAAHPSVLSGLDCKGGERDTEEVLDAVRGEQLGLGSRVLLRFCTCRRSS